MTHQQAIDELSAAKATIARLRKALEKHHKWHLEIGEVVFPSDDRSPDTTIDLTDAYSDSSLCEETVKALADTPPEPPLDLNSTTPAGLPLTIGVESDQLVIRIGVDTLAFCFEMSEDNQPFDDEAQDFRRAWRVDNRHKFAEGVAIGLQLQEEDGSTPLTHILDAACIRAIEDDMGVEEDGRIVTHEMLHPVAPPAKAEAPVCGTCGGEREICVHTKLPWSKCSCGCCERGLVARIACRDCRPKERS